MGGFTLSSTHKIAATAAAVLGIGITVYALKPTPEQRRRLLRMPAMLGLGLGTIKSDTDVATHVPTYKYERTPVATLPTADSLTDESEPEPEVEEPEVEELEVEELEVAEADVVSCDWKTGDLIQRRWNNRGNKRDKGMARKAHLAWSPASPESPNPSVDDSDGQLTITCLIENQGDQKSHVRCSLHRLIDGATHVAKSAMSRWKYDARSAEHVRSHVLPTHLRPEETAEITVDLSEVLAGRYLVVLNEERILSEHDGQCELRDDQWMHMVFFHEKIDSTTAPPKPRRTKEQKPYDRQHQQHRREHHRQRRQAPTRFSMDKLHTKMDRQRGQAPQGKKRRTSHAPQRKHTR
jgi:hypothetical protein